MNVLIIVPRYAKQGEFYNWPIGLTSIYAFLKREGVSVSVLNLCHEPHDDTLESLKKAYALKPFNVVGTGGLAMSWKLCDDIFTSAKRFLPEVITIAGGALVTADPELAIRNLPIDFGVSGEGEYTIVELLKALKNGNSPDSIKGLTFIRKNGEFVFTGPRKEISDLDSLPIPEYEDFGFREWMTIAQYSGRLPIPIEPDDEVRFAEVLGSRSCPFSCTFCFHPLGKIYRKRSIDHVFKEIDHLTNTYGINMVSFNDELFAAKNEQILEFAERIRPYNIKYLSQLRVNDVRQEVLEKMVKSGCVFSAFGVESVCDPVLKSMKKKITRAEIVSAFAIARKTRLFCSGNIILGDPADTMETMNESISWLRENQTYNLGLNFIVAVPDAPIYRLALARGKIRNKLEHVKNYFPIVNLTKLSAWKFYNLLLKVQFWNLFNSNNTAGVLIGSKKFEEQHQGKNFYLLEMRCPFCNGEQKRKLPLTDHRPNVLVICAHCFAPFKISQKEAFYDDFSLFSTTKLIFAKMVNVFLMRFSFARTYIGILRDFYNRKLKPST